MDSGEDPLLVALRQTLRLDYRSLGDLTSLIISVERASFRPGQSCCCLLVSRGARDLDL
jgi:hypothetical protein